MKPFHANANAEVKMPSLLDTRYEKESNVVTRQVAGEIILVPIVRRIGEEACLYTLDEIAAFLWEKLDGEQTGRSLAEALQTSYSVEPSQAETDVEAFLQQLESIGAIRSAPSQ